MKKRSERGGVFLIEMLLVLLIVLVLAAAIVPSALKIQAVSNEVAAAQVLARINAAELTASQIYGGYLLPSVLAQNNLANPTNACFPNLLTGSDGQPSATSGYAFNFTPGTVSGTTISASANCSTPPVLYQGYTLTANPISHSPSLRFFYTDQAKVITFVDGHAATSSDQIYAVSGTGGSGGNSGGNQGNSGAPSLWYGQFDATKTYPIGAEVEYTVPGNISPSLFLLGTNTPSGATPIEDAADWFAISIPISSAVNGSLPADLTTLSGSASSGLNCYDNAFGCGTNAANNGPPNYYGGFVKCALTVALTGSCGTSNPSGQIYEPFVMHSFTISGPSNWAQGNIIVYVNDDTAVSTLASCTITNGNSCSVSASVNIPALHYLSVGFRGQGGAVAVPGALSWSLQ